MYLKNLHLRGFRNYIDQNVTFETRKTIVVGDNAQGKSNLLEAIEVLATLGSHRSTRDRDLVRETEKEARIEATVARTHGEAELAVTLRKKGRRTLRLNSDTLQRQTEFLGQLNAVEFSSLDLELVRGGPERRRHWLDALLIQLEPVYARILQQYQQVLRQRNALLKKIRDESPPSEDAMQQLFFWDAQLAANGSRVTRRRARVLQRLAPLARDWHAKIGGAAEILAVTYLPNVRWEEDNPESVQQSFLEKIQQRNIAERQLGTSVVGPHRDEVELSIDGTPARFYGSQGQQRTLVLALKLAELNLIEAVVGESPVLLLDDVLAELDLKRQNQLLEAIQDRFQTLITTTHIHSFDAHWLEEAQILSVSGGQICGFD